ncbi:rhomboid family intramembrane serine protease [Wenyingzhuangia sp. chi5]|uniref:Rhomboid family intramembrane serine protease n=1 Tax=Wenyingzhuangia gilva TaxID=3057677 RepID=A0ABT8VRP0_9FLAO|nr:rhomboid family intramembrane serine protease [Wenyingzhuangia sp. chi5]MDO3694639.1 rhomboid family intramembrane serine protease [Wenyingzhuangia sp. chi5]
MTHKSIILFLAIIYGVSILGFLFPVLKLGILPRKSKGLIGIITSPFFHNHWKHLLSNTLPLIVLLFTLQYFYASQTLYVLTIIIFMGGGLLWLFGRKANHIGASGLIYGLTAFIITNGFVSFKPIPLLVSIITIVVYGGLIFGAFPSNKKNTSWEGHLLYAVAGVFAAYICKNAYYIIH